MRVLHLAQACSVRFIGWSAPVNGRALWLHPQPAAQRRSRDNRQQCVSRVVIRTGPDPSTARAFARNVRFHDKPARPIRGGQRIGRGTGPRIWLRRRRSVDRRFRVSGRPAHLKSISIHTGQYARRRLARPRVFSFCHPQAVEPCALSGRLGWPRFLLQSCSRSEQASDHARRRLP